MLKLQEIQPVGLEPVSFELARGECLALQGPSGSGKTVLLRAIADLDSVRGRISLDGTDRSAMSGPAWRRRVRFAPAEPGWWEDTPRAHFRNFEHASLIAAELGLERNLLDRPIAKLSTGERQRLALARAIEDSPDILLLDEPTGALDTMAAARVESLLKHELEAGKAIVFVSHDPDQLARMAGRKAVIRDRRVEVRTI